MRWIALAVGAFALVWLWSFGRQTVSALLARRRGTLIKAQVTRVDGDGRRKRGKYALQWVDDTGVSGQSLYSNVRERYDAYPPGSRIDLYLCPDGRRWWVGDVGPRRDAPTVPDVDARAPD